MSALPSGSAYLYSYPGILNVLEEVFNITTVIILLVEGLDVSAYLLNTISILAFSCTLTLIILHMREYMRMSRLSWHWIECGTVLIIAIFFAIFSSMVMITFTTGYVVAAMFGYILSTIYFLHAFNKYRLATTPLLKYAWTTPNMPDLN